MIIRVLEATPSIPKGFQFEVESLTSGTEVIQSYNGSNYRFPIEKITHVEGNKYVVSNSNVVVLVEVFDS